MLISTPWEDYEVNNIPVWVKREDLCSAPPAPPFSKIRGLCTYLSKVKRMQGKHVVVGVMDTQHSMAGWGAAYVCNELGLACIDFFPVLKADKSLRYNQIKAKELGATLYPMKAGMSAVLFNQAKKILKDQCNNYIMLPNGLKLTETVQATALEVIEHTPTYLQGGVWVVSISSATIGSGVIKGISDLGFKATVILHMGYSRSADQVHHYVKSMAGDHPYVAVQVVDESYEYKDKVDNAWIPFPCNPWYDAKAFTWLARNITCYADNQPIIFWNCGA